MFDRASMTGLLDWARIERHTVLVVFTGFREDKATGLDSMDIFLLRSPLVGINGKPKFGSVQTIDLKELSTTAAVFEESCYREDGENGLKIARISRINLHCSDSTKLGLSITIEIEYRRSYSK